MYSPGARTVEVELGGAVRHLQMDYEALMEFQNLTGRDPLKGQLGRFGTRDLATLVLVALKHEDPDLTLQDVARWVHLGNAAYVMEQAVSSASEGAAARNLPSAPTLAAANGGTPPEGTSAARR